MDHKYPQKLKLKSGDSLEVRPVTPKDEDALYKFFTDLPENCTEFLKDNVRDPAVIRRFLTKSDPNMVWALVALEKSGKIVADASIHTTILGWKRHIGEIRVVVAPSHHKQGLAKGLIHHLVNYASIKELKKLEAQILSNQEGARRAFEHLGFREEARLVDHALDHKHRFHDLVILTNTVEDMWRQMEDMISDMEIARCRY
jgi:RimJ/RimL family protein N-acetyltransferase